MSMLEDRGAIYLQVLGTLTVALRVIVEVYRLQRSVKKRREARKRRSGAAGGPQRVRDPP